MNAAQSSPSPLSEPVRTALRLLLIGIFLGPTLMAIAYTLLLAWFEEAEPVDAPASSE